ncbi:MAG: ABC transporter ATP-binding protein [Bifidobacteriaceae bacterium]|jgi:teichoic acid transport system ATP-binding protein|nr:ABC transporter ATP-binding protein [Bifidobacteriaceae bacterium]
MAGIEEIDFSLDEEAFSGVDRPGRRSGQGERAERGERGGGDGQGARGEPGADQQGAGLGGGLGVPTMVVDQVHVRYRVFGGRKLGAPAGTKPSLYRRIFDRASRSVGSVSEVHAVRGVSFVAHEGESIGIVGRNGAGKSTLLRAIAGLMPYSEGAVYAAGQCALLGVNAALLMPLTGERNIMLGGLALGLTRTEVRQRFDSIVEFAGIGEFARLPMNAYSSGMASRLRFAISTSKVPDILMIDEALSTGDAEFQRRSRDKILEVQEQAGTVFLVSHSAKAIEAMCERALWLDKGELVMDGPASDVLAAYRAGQPPAGCPGTAGGAGLAGDTDLTGRPDSADPRGEGETNG